MLRRPQKYAAPVIVQLPLLYMSSGFGPIFLSAVQNSSGWIFALSSHYCIYNREKAGWPRQKWNICPLRQSAPVPPHQQQLKNQTMNSCTLASLSDILPRSEERRVTVGAVAGGLAPLSYTNSWGGFPEPDTLGTTAVAGHPSLELAATSLPRAFQRSTATWSPHPCIPAAHSQPGTGPQTEGPFVFGRCRAAFLLFVKCLSGWFREVSCFSGACFPGRVIAFQHKDVKNAIISSVMSPRFPCGFLLFWHASTAQTQHNQLAVWNKRLLFQVSNKWHLILMPA